MDFLRRFQLKNTMVIANGVSNLIGAAAILYMSRPIKTVQFVLVSHTFRRISLIFMIFTVVAALAFSLIYERPIRRYFELCFQRLTASPELTLRARQKLLNEPFFLIALDAMVWISAAIFYPVYFWRLGLSREVILGAVGMNLQTGLVSVTTAFFLIEFFLQRRLAPYFFPDGGLSGVPETIRIRIRTRCIAFLAATNLIPLFSFARSSWGITNALADPQMALVVLHATILSNALVFVAVGFGLTFLISSNLTRPLADMTAVLQKIRTGDFESRIDVTSNDELGYVGDVINEMASGLKEREWIRETFGKYVSKEIRDEVLSHRIPLDGEIREVTVLFADLRDYTPLVEKTSPQQVVRIINRYFGEMEKAIRAHGGLILQFMGDEIEAVFGAPIPLDDHATCALMAAMSMDSALQLVNHTLKCEGNSPLQHGIGIHSGDALAATIGSPSRLSYALVGDTVNVASRLQEANKLHGTSIIVSAETRRRLSKAMPLHRLPDTTLKGIKTSIRIYGI